MSKVDGKSDCFTLVVVGSGGVGKSCLTVRFLKDEFMSEYDPTIEENYRKTVSVDGKSCVLNIVDTAGQQEYTALRDQHLTAGDGFLLVFSLIDAASLEEALQLRKAIVNLKDSSKIPFVLVGNKCDLPNHAMTKEKIMESIGSLKIPYLQTSAKENINVIESFHELVKESRLLKGKQKKKGGCLIL